MNTNNIILTTKSLSECSKLNSLPDFSIVAGTAITDKDGTVIFAVNNDTGTLYAYAEESHPVPQAVLLQCMRNILHSRYIKNISYNNAARSLIHALNQYMNKTDGAEVKTEDGYIYHFQTSILK